jgi:hypothetical protein
MMWDEFRLKELGLMDQDSFKYEYGPKAWGDRMLSDDPPSFCQHEEDDL